MVMIFYDSENNPTIMAIGKIRIEGHDAIVPSKLTL